MTLMLACVELAVIWCHAGVAREDLGPPAVTPTMPLNASEASLLFEVVCRCYERGSIVFTSNAHIVENQQARMHVALQPPREGARGPRLGKRCHDSGRGRELDLHTSLRGLRTQSERHMRFAHSRRPRSIAFSARSTSV